MSKVWISSDWHIGHKNIHKFRSIKNGFFRDFTCEADHREWLGDCVASTVRKRDVLYLLGDIAFTEEALEFVGKLPGRKVLVKGNHDVKKSSLYSKVFDQVHGLTKYKGRWLSHAPMHPVELRGKVNFHGHVHFHSLEDRKSYQNVCVEELMKVFGKPLVDIESIKAYRELCYE